MSKMMEEDTVTPHTAAEADADLLVLCAALQAGQPLEAAANSAVAAALEELRRLRAQAERERIRRQAVGSHDVIIEGFSDESADAAFSEALSKVTYYFSEYHDVATTLLGLEVLPLGGHKATLQLRITPMTIREKEDREGPEAELHHMHDAHELARKQKHEGHAEDMMHEHFLLHSGITPQSVPDYFMINLKDSDLLNQMIEKEFFKATHKAPDISEGMAAVMAVPRIKVRVRHPAPDGTVEAPVNIPTTTSHGE